jgi:predicted RNase H-like HicB family nuclease
VSEPLSILIDRTESGMFRASAPDLPGVTAEAETVQQVLAELGPKVELFFTRSAVSSDLPNGGDASGGDEGFDADLAYVLDKNAELYRRLAQ